MSETTHDFGDGRGPVPAHRHHNPDGTAGGWVANTAIVAPTAYIGPDALVYGLARIFDTARVCGSARICGWARVGGRARVYDAARICGWARVGDNAHIGDNANVTLTRHWLQVGPIGSEDRHVTIHRQADDTARIVAGCWAGTPDELEARIDNAWADADEAERARWRADYRLVIAAARARQAEWAAQ